ncbi:hypothetical protein GCM10011490_17640 [Pseudoclavibacter endophyticus]|uniref:Uncharacterized protein n=1 Tax=Pseudoclavibacter endophyticus TaxID=1778590 RepID=A0A6H9WRF0_9MICO|nr:permease prefix domain 1-containing protein [Pseudoclavibacter endophyticus]KAB1648884.1 hypothetical protein F8O04_00840 [Pseudoclavibacter endophyticus]GGA67521.1 hypothetical protein GCM10011490_17640 [Pseudoclavibacter endophyticus]
MNDTIRTYIGGLFADLPSSPEIERAHAELQQMSEDKYRELREAGVSEHEATGRVITEFGNLDELADALGIRREVDDAALGPKVPILSSGEVDGMLRRSRSASMLIAGGVWLILIGLGCTVLIGQTEYAAAGAVPLLLAVAIAVGMFIVGGRATQRSIGTLQQGEARVEPRVAEDVSALRERSEGGFTAAIVAGVGIIILSVAIPTTLTALQVDGASTLGSVGLLIVVGLGIGILVVSGMRRSALDTVVQSGRPRTPVNGEDEARASLIGRVAAVYWPAVVLVYLAWSFLGSAWGQSWVVFPIAGVGFAVVVGLVALFRPAGSSVSSSAGGAAR